MNAACWPAAVRPGLFFAADQSADLQKQEIGHLVFAARRGFRARRLA